MFTSSICFRRIDFIFPISAIINMSAPWSATVDLATITLPVPVTSSQVLRATAPNTGLQPYAAWQTYFRSAADGDNQAYAKAVRKTSVTAGQTSSSQLTAAVQSRWQLLVTEVTLVAPTSTDLQTPNLDQRLDAVVAGTLDPLLLELSSCPSPLLLTHPRLNWRESALPWATQRDLQDVLVRTSIAAANALLAKAAARKRSGYIIDIVHEDHVRPQYPALVRELRSKADFYVVTGHQDSVGSSSSATSSAALPTSTGVRVSAIIELKPMVTLTFLAYMVIYMRRFFDAQPSFDNLPSLEIPGRPRGWCNRIKAFKLAMQIFGDAARSGAPLIVLFTGWHLLVFERRRRPGDDSRKIRLHVHLIILAQAGPTPSSEPIDEAAAPFRELWTVSTARNLPSALALLALMADGLDHPFEPFEPDAPPAPNLDGNSTASTGSADSEDEPSYPLDHPSEPDAPPAPTLDGNSTASTGPADSEDAQPYPPLKHRLDVESTLLNTLPTRQAQLKTSHSLLRQLRAFAHGLHSRVHQACLVPNSTAWDGCVDLGSFERERLAPCSTLTHVRVIAKGVCSDGDDVAASQRALEEEAKAYESLVSLQGKALPAFFGRWGTESTFYVYEDVGASLSDVSAISSLDLTIEEKRTLGVQLRQCLKLLHQAGYVHQDVFERNVCVRRVALHTPPMPSATFKATLSPAPDPPEQAMPSFRHTSRPTSPTRADMGGSQVIQGRLIDLTEAKMLTSIPAEQHAVLKERDTKQLDDVLADLLDE